MGNKSIFVLISMFLLSSLISNQSLGLALGAPFDISKIKDENLPKAIDFAKLKYQQKYSKQIGELYNVRVQIVNGKNYLLTFKDSQENINKLKINFKPWTGEFILID